ncbi:MAG: hypothetical protein IKP96_01985 [Elusimicrobiaceae bacterium]|nr:hypothetical protein [Elusimicrobiaceae bacterium]
MRIKLPRQEPVWEVAFCLIGVGVFLIAVFTYHDTQDLFVPVFLSGVATTCFLPIFIKLVRRCIFHVKPIGQYTQLNFTETDVFIGNSDPLLNRVFPYDKTQISFVFKTGLRNMSGNYTDNLFGIPYIKHITLTFTQDEVCTLEIHGNWPLTSTFIHQLLDQIQHFEKYNIIVTPQMNENNKHEQTLAAFVREQIQIYLNGGKMLIIPPLKSARTLYDMALLQREQQAWEAEEVSLKEASAIIKDSSSKNL